MRLRTLPCWMASFVASYLVCALAAMAVAERAFAWFYLPGLLAMAIVAQLLEPIGLATAGMFMPNPTTLGWIVLIAIFSGGAYALGWVIRALAGR